jgi:hypothetical protein
MMAADVEEPAQDVVVSSNKDDWLTNEFKTDVLSRLAHLLLAGA